jgi:hypothetical protein
VIFYDLKRRFAHSWRLYALGMVGDFQESEEAVQVASGLVAPWGPRLASATEQYSRAVVNVSSMR